MTEFFLRILENSLSACWLVAAVLLVRLLFQKAPQKLFPLLWSLVGLRLMLPFKAPSPFSLVPQVEVERASLAFPLIKIMQILWLPVFLGLLCLGLVSYFRLVKEKEMRRGTVGIIGTDKLEALYSFQNGEAKLVEGRSFTREEAERGEKLVVISEVLAAESGLIVGDTVDLSAYWGSMKDIYRLNLAMQGRRSPARLLRRG